MINIRFEELARTRYTEMVDWCNRHFGKSALWIDQLENKNSPTSWYTNNNYAKNKSTITITDIGAVRFSFKTDKEATLFSLRWSELP